jgi:hypothetical protein
MAASWSKKMKNTSCKNPRNLQRGPIFFLLFFNFCISASGGRRFWTVWAWRLRFWYKKLQILGVKRISLGAWIWSGLWFGPSGRFGLPPLLVGGTSLRSYAKCGQDEKVQHCFHSSNTPLLITVHSASAWSWDPPPSYSLFEFLPVLWYCE